MAPNNATIAALLRRYASALALEGANRFRIKAYRKAADTLDTLPQSVAAVVAKGEDLKQFPGVGPAISTAIEEVVRTGTLPQLDRLTSTLSPELLELADWPGLDLKKVKRIYKKLGIHTVNELRSKLNSGEIEQAFDSIHSRFALGKQQQTERIMRAMDNPYFNILGHATGRLLLKRQGYEIDIDRIVEHARTNGCFFEINSSPDRLDLSEVHARMAKDAGVKIAINTDAHSPRELRFMAAGINQARRAWLSADDVLNTYPVRKLLTLLKRA